MDIRTPGQDLKGISNATVLLKTGESISVGYIDPKGHFHSFNVMAQHLVFMVTHEETEATMICRPSTGIQYVEPAKK